MKTRLLACLVLALSLWSVSFNAQAYDGYADRKIFLGYSNLGGASGVEFQYDIGLSDLISFGNMTSIYFDPKKRVNEYGDEVSRPFNEFFNFEGFLRFHFSSTFNLGEKIDPYLGGSFGMRGLAIHGGIKYNFSELVGGYTQFKQEVVQSPLSGDNKSEKMGTFSLGLTFNLY